MTLFQALILGVVQGATEFIPISSSAHLVLVPWALGWQLDHGPAFIFDVLVQWGTLVAVIAYFRADLKALVGTALSDLLRGRPFARVEGRLAWLLLLASAPAAAAGLLIKDQVQQAFTDPGVVSLFLLVTAGLLAASERIGSRTREVEQIGWLDALWIGAAQALALFPGISRSGSTIAGGMSRDLRRAAAARFSFLMSVPVMLGAGLIALVDLAGTANAGAQLAPLAVGFLGAVVVGYLSIRWLLDYLSRRPLTVFIVYCTAVGLAGLLADALS